MAVVMPNVEGVVDEGEAAGKGAPYKPDVVDVEDDVPYNDAVVGVNTDVGVTVIAIGATTALDFSTSCAFSAAINRGLNNS